MLPRPSSPSETVATMRRPADAPAVSPRSQLWIPLAFLVFWIAPLLVSCDELAVALHPAKVRLPPGQLVEGSPGSKPGAALACSRVHIRGVSRLRHLNRLFHSLKVKVDLVPTDGSSRIPTAEVCLHRNASTGVGMCPPGGWQKLSRGSWAQSISPFQDKILDLRMQPAQSSSAVDVSTEEEFFLYRVVFLIMGFALMAFARILSESVVFYYGSAMAVGIILVVLVVLFQGMRLLPTGRKSSLAIFMYSSVVGVGTFLLHYLSGLLRSALVEMGISEDIHKPHYILNRWTKFVTRKSLTSDGDYHMHCEHSNLEAIRISHISRCTTHLAYLAGRSKDIYNVILSDLTQTLEKVSILENQLLQSEHHTTEDNEEQVKSTMSAQEEVTDTSHELAEDECVTGSSNQMKLHNPHISHTKGNRMSKGIIHEKHTGRIKGGMEISVRRALGKRRSCKLCGEHGHNRRSCKSKTKGTSEISSSSLGTIDENMEEQSSDDTD